MFAELDPLRDPRWPAFIARHPSASAFHKTGWLEALQRTYGYRPVVFATCEPGAGLTNGLVFCEVDSWITGRRLVSLPFSDHCAPLAGDPKEFSLLLEALRARLAAGRYRYAELRLPGPNTGQAPAFQPVQRFFHHLLDLRPGAAAVFQRFQKDCIQRKIRRAEKERIAVTEGRDETDLERFFHLLLLTRRRHGVPPQPMAWFRNLFACLQDSVRLRIASYQGRPVAAIVTIEHGHTLYYKYGASDASFHRLGAMPFLFWQAIQDAAGRGLAFLDLGRSGIGGTGLIQFKEHLGAVRSDLTYWRCPVRSAHVVGRETWPTRVMHTVCTIAPDRCLAMLGTLLYRHSA